MDDHRNTVPNRAVLDERESALLRLREAALIAFADQEILEGISLEEASAALPPEIRAELDKLGSAKDFARRIVAECKRQELATPEAERPTFIENQANMANQANESTWAGVPTVGKPTLAGFDALRKRHDAWSHNLKELGWSRKYLKREKLGSGGQGDVYRLECLDDFSGSRALKILSPAPYGEVGSYVDDMQRMRRVASVVHQIQHYNLVEVDYFEPHDHIYTMVMRLIDGFDLRRLLQQASLTRLKQAVDPQRWDKLNQVVYTAPGDGEHRPSKWGLQPGMAENIIEKCLRGVGGLHDKQIVHGDIKPSNIMLGCDGGIRLIDINSAFELSSLPKVSAWTPRYAPPEVLTERAWSPRSDLASLGYVLIELLSGQPAALGPNVSSESTRSTGARSYPELLEAKMRLPDRLSKLLPKDTQKSSKLVNLCKGLINPDPSERFQSARDALTGESGAIPFRHELIHADLAVDWVEEIQCWIRDMKRAITC